MLRREFTGHMQTAINQAMQWATFHGFKFSPSKTMAMHALKYLGLFLLVKVCVGTSYQTIKGEGYKSA